MPTDKPKTRSRSGPIAALVLIGVLVFYVLSVGPASRMVQEGWIARELAAAVYAPLEWVAGNVPPVRRPLVWYVKLWDKSDPHPLEPYLH